MDSESLAGGAHHIRGEITRKDSPANIYHTLAEKTAKQFRPRVLLD